MARHTIATPTLRALPASERRTQIVRAYRETRALERAAALLGIPTRTLTRIIESDPPLRDRIDAIRTRSQ